MARIEYDEDDDHPRGPRSPWQRRLLIWGLALVGLGLGFLVPYTLYLNQQLEQQFEALRWQEPTRVYARPLQLSPGLVLDAQTLRHELQAAGYREADGSRPGTWAEQDDGSWRISSHGFQDVDGEVTPRQVEMRLSGGRVSRLREAGGDQALEQVRLDPARIATLYGARQEERRLVRVEEVPVLLTDALQAVEDRDFARHHGIDLSGMMRAAWVNLRTRSTRQGGSTLTQQLARSGLLGIGREQTWSRKFNEIIYALLIELRYDKGQIMEAYLNQVYVGQRGNQAIRGMAAGAEFWFGRRLEDLETEHVALLVGMIRGPSYYDPRRHPERARERRDFALAQMHSTGLIDEAGYQRALAAPLGVSDRPGSVAANRFPAYVDLVRQQLASEYPANELQGAGLSVMTSMSPSAQGYAEGAVRRTIEALASDDRPELQAGLVLTDVHDGEVLAVVGNRNPAQHGFNRAIDAQRPVGSLLKPFVYLLALAMPGEWSLASPIDDSPVSVVLPNGQRWTPANADNRSHGTVSLMDALARSYNQATVRLGMQIDPRRLAELIGTLAGVEAEPNPSLILGSLDQSPYAMAQLYQFLASGGEFQALRMVRGVIDADGRTVSRYDESVTEAQAGDAVAVRLVTLALQRAVTSGTARRLVDDGLGHLNAAGKTGTSNDGRDSWFAGWTGDHLAVVWMGNDRNESTGLYGATGAMRVWSDMFARLPSAPLEIGDGGLDWRWIAGGHSVDAGCPGARRYAFVPGFAPARQPCDYGEPEPAEAASAQAGAPAASAPRRPARRGWRSWFGLDEPEPEPPADPPPASPEPVPDQP
ncbi:MAG: penicillin-binding protein 1B [Luteimonas sp.]